MAIAYPLTPSMPVPQRGIVQRFRSVVGRSTEATCPTCTGVAMLDCECRWSDIPEPRRSELARDLAAWSRSRGWS